MSRFSALAGATVTGAVLGAAVFVGVAHADTSSVTFDGASLLGLPVLSCASQPTPSTISMSADDTLEVKNLTGYDAVVYVNGSKATSNSDIGSNSMAPITFPVGTWKVALKPTCLLNLNDAGAVTVTVSAPAPAATTDPKAADVAPTAQPAAAAPTKAPKPAKPSTATNSTAKPNTTPNPPKSTATKSNATAPKTTAPNAAQPDTAQSDTANRRR